MVLMLAGQNRLFIRHRTNQNIFNFANKTQTTMVQNYIRLYICIVRVDSIILKQLFTDL